MQTEIIGGGQGIVGAVEALRAGEVVAVPTETVYGLAGDALRPEAVARVFEAKERPRFDPLIIHLPDITWLERLTNVPTSQKEIVCTLVNAFWPGPFTLVLPKNKIVSGLVTAGLDTVALRMSAHAVFQEVITKFGRPLAAPSANRFGRISPTTAQHVLAELEGRIPLIVDGGPTIHGVESTVVAVSDNSVEVLRPGPVTEEMLRGVLRRIDGSPMLHRPAADTTNAPRSPGQLPSHYAPKTPLRLVNTDETVSWPDRQRAGLLAWTPPQTNHGFKQVRLLSPERNLREAAANLFRFLRELDTANLDLILAEPVPEQGLGVAINDRLRRAAHR